MTRVHPARSERKEEEHAGPTDARGPQGSSEIRRARSPDAGVLERARSAYLLSGRRSAILGSGLFADPGWNMLLDLLLAEADGDELSVTSACLGSGSAQSTALRYLKLLRKAGLVERLPDSADRRRTIVRLTDRGWDSLHELLRTGRGTAAA